MMPQSDESAYDGNLVVKRTTYGKSSRGNSRVAEVDRVKRAIDTLNKEADRRLTIDALNLDDARVLEFQVAVNKEVVAELRKVTLMLKTFVANNSNSIDNE